MDQSSSSPQTTYLRDHIFEIIITILLTGIALAAIIVAQGFKGAGLATDVGPARFPVIYATILIVLCGVLAFQNISAIVKQRYTEPAPVLSKRQAALIATGMLLTVFQYWAMIYIGYFASMFIYLCLLMALMGLRHFVINPAISAAMTALIFIAFDYLLDVPLPVGELFE